MDDNQNKPSKAIQILIGIGISLVSYALTVGNLFITKSMVITSIIALIVLALFAFLVVKFFRKGYRVVAITMLILITPQIFFLLFFGACSIIMISLS